MAAVTGKVSTQAQRIRSTTLKFRALKRLAHPTPMMLVVMAWVVLTGIPKWAATLKTVAAVVSAAKPWTGCSFTILCPMVLMIFHPPAAVPKAMVSAQTILIHVAIPSLPAASATIG